MAAEPLGVWGADSEMEARLRAVPGPAHPGFEDLYREHFDRLRRFILGMTGRQTVAEDIAQETLLRAYIRVEKLDFDRPLWPWLKKVATRLVYDHTRDEREFCSDEVEPVAPVTGSDLADRFANRELVEQALRRLPARQRAAVTLRYLEDWKSSELAELFNLPRPAVEQLLHRARRSLSAEYRRLGGERLRIALWPLFALLIRLRDRAVRFANQAGHVGSTSVAGAVDATTQVMVAVVVGSGLVASGVALAAPNADYQRVPVAESARAVEQKAVEAARLAAAAAARTEDAMAQSVAARRAAASRSSEHETTQAGQTASAHKARAVEFTTPEQRVLDAASPEGQVKGGRNPNDPDDKITIQEEVNAGAAGVNAGAKGDVSVGCGGGQVMASACQAYNNVDAAVPELP